ncbi:trypsin-like peptidase domain-containing protein [Proteiniclasticum sp.]|uniref:S1C family serine protease n=1 Tax=Proteiniclasticum sp. TaxID=2053595 RepID=UPI0028A1CF33|nr:trypsin-like peptidase domain-containing protein [Proteiniclasticum sp.]
MEDNNLEQEKLIEKENLKEQVKTGEIRYRLDQRSRIRGGILQFASLLVVVLLTSILTSTFVSRKIQEDSLVIDADSSFSQMLRKSLSGFETSFYDRTRIREVYNQISVSLVGVTNDPQNFYSESYDHLYTGVVMNTEGYILVPYSAVSPEGFYVRTDRENDRIYQAELIGGDAALGLALIRVEDISLRPPKFSDSSTVKTAQSVIAMGNPFGDSDRGTVTFGVISTVNKAFPTVTADNREVKVYAIETDAKINTGNNGGVLVNMNGEVVGINSMSITEGSEQGLSAAITSNEAMSITRSLINSGEELLPFLGIFGDVVKDLDDFETGFYIQRIAPEGTADRAGLRPTDILVSIDDIPVETAASIDEYIRTRKVGDVVKIRYLRTNEVLEVEATLYGTTVD